MEHVLESPGKKDFGVLENPGIWPLQVWESPGKKHFYVCTNPGCVSYSVLNQEIGWEKHSGNELFCVGWDMKP